MDGFKETAFPDPIERMCVNPQRLCPQSQDLHKFGPHNSQHWEREWTQSATPNPETICIWNMLEKGKSIFFNGVIGCINHAPGLANTHKLHVCSFVLCTFCFILIVFVLLIFFFILSLSVVIFAFFSWERENMELVGQEIRSRIHKELEFGEGKEHNYTILYERKI